MSKPQRSEDSKHQRRQGCFESATAKLGILVACVILTVPSHNVCGTHNQPMTNGGRQTKSLRITGDRRVHNATITMRHTEHTVTVTQPGQSECTLILTQSHTIPLTPTKNKRTLIDSEPTYCVTSTYGNVSTSQGVRVYGSQPQRAHWQTLPVNTVRFQQTLTIPVSNAQGYQQCQSHTPRRASTEQFQAGMSGRNTSSGGGSVSATLSCLELLGAGPPWCMGLILFVSMGIGHRNGWSLLELDRVHCSPGTFASGPFGVAIRAPWEVPASPQMPVRHQVDSESTSESSCSWLGVNGIMRVRISVHSL